MSDIFLCVLWFIKRENYEKLRIASFEGKLKTTKGIEGYNKKCVVEDWKSSGLKAAVHGGDYLKVTIKI